MSENPTTAECIEIQLTKGQHAIIDAQDYALVSGHRWYASNNKYGCFYAASYTPLVNGKREMIRMHRLIVDAPQHLQVDHVNGNGLDNRRSNLRLCTFSQNMKNLHKKQTEKSSQFKGVSYKKNERKWVAYVRVDGKPITIGRFNSETEAALAYNEAAIIHYGEFANPNVIGREAGGQ